MTCQATAIIRWSKILGWCLESTRATTPATMAARLRFNLPAALGTEDVLVDELAELGIEARTSGRGAISFLGQLEDGYRACLWARTATRVLLEIGHFPAETADQLYQGVSKIHWKDHMGPESSLAVTFAGSSQGINNTQFGARRTKDAVVDQLRSPSGQRPRVDLKNPDLRLNVHLRKGKATVAIDLSGESLHLRGTRAVGGPAPLKETLAATILRIAEWPRLAKEGAPLLDPMCGSGTLLLEAAGYALDIAPGLNRQRWGFSAWRGHNAALWKSLCREASARRDTAASRKPLLFGSDKSANQIQASLRNAERAGLGALLHLQRCEVAERGTPSTDLPGLVVTNPPYGARIGDAQSLVPLYRNLGDMLRQRFLGWNAFVLVDKGPLIGKIGLKPKRRHVLFNGPIECRLLEIPISSRPVHRLKD